MVTRVMLGNGWRSSGHKVALEDFNCSLRFEYCNSMILYDRIAEIRLVIVQA